MEKLPEDNYLVLKFIVNFLAKVSSALLLMLYNNNSNNNNTNNNNNNNIPWLSPSTKEG